MTFLHLVRKNLGRKKVRTLFTALSIVVAFILFGLLGALNQGFSGSVSLAGVDRLVTIHKVSLIQLLPIAYGARISNLEGVEAVSHYTWFGGYFQDPRQQVFSTPTDPDTFREVYAEFEIDPDQFQAWQNNRVGMLAGKSLADTFGWQVGDRIPIGSTIWPTSDGSYGWEFVLEAVYDDGDPANTNEQQFFFHYEYFNETRQFGKDLIGWYTVKISDPENAEEMAAAIDALFANSPTETKTTTEKGFAQGFVDQVGDIGAIVRYILLAVFFTMLLVTANTMAQSVRERTNELAVLKTLGFSDTRILVMVLSESTLLSVVAGVLGLMLAYVAVGGFAASVSQFLPGLALTNATLVLGLVLTVVLGLITGIAPALSAMRLNVVQALARR